jgi:Aft1 HRA domain/Aft1 osmotic stress response (OSM) domain
MLQRPPEAIQQTVAIAPPQELLPENYASLPQNSKLDEEPNPFEKSFSGLPAKNPSPPVSKPVLPPVTSMDSPSAGVPTFKKATVDQFAWGSLRAGPLSPSMLQGPVNNALVPLTATPAVATTTAAATMRPVDADEFVPYQPQIPTSMQYSFQANTQPAHVNNTKYGGRIEVHGERGSWNGSILCIGGVLTNRNSSNSIPATTCTYPTIC